jgi:hypothetical protein
MFTPFRWITVRVLSTPPRTFDSDAAVPAISERKPIACFDGGLGFRAKGFWIRRWGSGLSI